MALVLLGIPNETKMVDSNIYYFFHLGNFWSLPLDVTDFQGTVTSEKVNARFSNEIYVQKLTIYNKTQRTITELSNWKESLVEKNGKNTEVNMIGKARRND